MQTSENPRHRTVPDTELKVTADEFCAADIMLDDFVKELRKNRYGFVGNWPMPTARNMAIRIWDRIYPVEKDGVMHLCLCGELTEMPRSGLRGEARFSIPTMMKATSNPVSDKEHFLLWFLNRGHYRVSLRWLRFIGTLIVFFGYAAFNFEPAPGRTVALLNTCNLILFGSLFYTFVMVLPKALVIYLLRGIKTRPFVPQVSPWEIRRAVKAEMKKLLKE